MGLGTTGFKITSCVMAAQITRGTSWNTIEHGRTFSTFAAYAAEGVTHQQRTCSP
jgi:hypothetical protein